MSDSNVGGNIFYKAQLDGTEVKAGAKQMAEGVKTPLEDMTASFASTMKHIENVFSTFQDKMLQMTKGINEAVDKLGDSKKAKENLKNLRESLKVLEQGVKVRSVKVEDLVQAPELSKFLANALVHGVKVGAEQLATLKNIFDPLRNDLVKSMKDAANSMSATGPERFLKRELEEMAKLTASKKIKLPPIDVATLDKNLAEVENIVKGRYKKTGDESYKALHTAILAMREDTGKNKVVPQIDPTLLKSGFDQIQKIFKGGDLKKYFSDLTAGFSKGKLGLPLDDLQNMKNILDLIKQAQGVIAQRARDAAAAQRESAAEAKANSAIQAKMWQQEAHEAKQQADLESRVEQIRERQLQLRAREDALNRVNSEVTRGTVHTQKQLLALDVSDLDTLELANQRRAAAIRQAEVQLTLTQQRRAAVAAIRQEEATAVKAAGIGGLSQEQRASFAERIALARNMSREELAIARGTIADSQVVWNRKLELARQYNERTAMQAKLGRVRDLADQQQHLQRIASLTTAQLDATEAESVRRSAILRNRLQQVQAQGVNDRANAPARRAAEQAERQHMAELAQQLREERAERRQVNALMEAEAQLQERENALRQIGRNIQESGVASEEELYAKTADELGALEKVNEARARELTQMEHSLTTADKRLQAEKALQHLKETQLKAGGTAGLAPDAEAAFTAGTNRIRQMTDFELSEARRTISGLQELWNRRLSLIQQHEKNIVQARKLGERSTLADQQTMIQEMRDADEHALSVFENTVSQRTAYLKIELDRQAAVGRTAGTATAAGTTAVLNPIEQVINKYRELYKVTISQEHAAQIASQQVKEFAGTTVSSVEKMKTAWKAVAQAQSHAFSQLDQWRHKILQISSQFRMMGSIAVGSFIGFLHTTKTLTEEFRSLSLETGLSLEQAQRMVGVFNQYGVSIPLAERTLKMLAFEFERANREAGEARDRFNKFGISMDELRAGGGNLNETMKIVSDHLRGIEDPMLRAAAATNIFGRSAAVMLPVLLAGSDAITQSMAKMPALSQAQAESLNSLAMSIENVITEFKILGADVIEAMRPTIEKAIAAFHAFAKTLRGIPGIVKNFAGAIAILVGAFSLMLGVLAPLLVSVASLVGMIMSMVGPITAAAEAAGGFAAVWAEAAAMAEVACDAIATAFAPISTTVAVVVAIVAALVAAFYSLMNGAGDMSTVFLGSLGGIKDAFLSVWEASKLFAEIMWDLIKIVGGVLFGALMAVAKVALTGLVAALGAVGLIVKAILDYGIIPFLRLVENILGTIFGWLMKLAVKLGIVNDGIAAMGHQVVVSSSQLTGALRTNIDTYNQWSSQIEGNTSKLIANAAVMGKLPELIAAWKDAIQQATAANMDPKDIAHMQAQLDMLKELKKVNDTMVKAPEKDSVPTSSDPTSDIKTSKAANAVAANYEAQMKLRLKQNQVVSEAEMAQMQESVLAQADMTDRSEGEMAEIKTKYMQQIESVRQQVQSSNLKHLEEEVHHQKDHVEGMVTLHREGAARELEAYKFTMASKIKAAYISEDAQEKLLDELAKFAETQQMRIAETKLKAEMKTEEELLKTKLRTGQVSYAQEIKDFETFQDMKITAMREAGAITAEQETAMKAKIHNRTLDFLKQFAKKEVETEREKIREIETLAKESIENLKEQKNAAIEKNRADILVGFARDEAATDALIQAGAVSEGEGKRRLFELSQRKHDAEMKFETQKADVAIETAHKVEAVEKQRLASLTAEYKKANNAYVAALAVDPTGGSEGVKTLKKEAWTAYRAMVKAAQDGNKQQIAADHEVNEARIKAADAHTAKVKEAFNNQKKAADDYKEAILQIDKFDKALAQNAEERAKQSMEVQIEQFQKLGKAAIEKAEMIENAAEREKAAAEASMKVKKAEADLYQDLVRTTREVYQTEFKQIMDFLKDLGALSKETMTGMRDALLKDIEIIVNAKGPLAIYDAEFQKLMGTYKEVSASLETMEKQQKGMGDFKIGAMRGKDGKEIEGGGAFMGGLDSESPVSEAMKKVKDRIGGAMGGLQHALKDTATNFTGVNGLAGHTERLVKSFSSLSEATDKLSQVMNQVVNPKPKGEVATPSVTTTPQPNVSQPSQNQPVGPQKVDVGASTGAVFNTKTNQWERSFGTEGQQHVPGSENTAPAAHASPSNIVVPGQMYRPRQPDPRDPNGPHGSLDNTGVQVSQTNHISLEGGVSAELVEPLKRVGAVLASFLPNPNSAGNLSTIRSMGVA